MASKLKKIIICMKAYDNEIVSEVAVVLMNGAIATDIIMLGQNYDETDEDLGSKIISEETDSRFVNEETTKIDIKCVNGNDAFIEEIANAIKNLASIFEDTEDDIDYIIYNDRLDSDNPYIIDGFETDLLDYISDMDENLIPIPFSSIFTGNQYLSDLLAKYKIKKHMFTATSPLSGAIWTSLIFDISSGRY